MKRAMKSCNEMGDDRWLWLGRAQSPNPALGAGLLTSPDPAASRRPPAASVAADTIDGAYREVGGGGETFGRMERRGQETRAERGGLRSGGTAWSGAPRRARRPSVGWNGVVRSPAPSAETFGRVERRGQEPRAERGDLRSGGTAWSGALRRARDPRRARRPEKVVRGY